MDLAGNRTIKRFRVAREGQTVDGRHLSRQAIIDMAQTYNPVEYTARINCEHWVSMMPNSEMTSFGDVVAVDYAVESFEIDGNTVELACLYATLSALPQLIELNKQGKKIFSSIEYYPKFADTGRAYLVGLALTDTPASRGVEAIKFSQNKPTFFTPPMELMLMTNHTESMTTTAQLSAVATADDSTQTTENMAQNAHESSFLSKMMALFSTKKGLTDDEQTAILDGFTKLSTAQSATDKQLDGLKNQVTELTQTVGQLNAMLTHLSTTSATTTEVPKATGGTAIVTDY